MVSAAPAALNVVAVKSASMGSRSIAAKTVAAQWCASMAGIGLLAEIVLGMASVCMEHSGSSVLIVVEAVYVSIESSASNATYATTWLAPWKDVRASATNSAQFDVSKVTRIDSTTALLVRRAIQPLVWWLLLKLLRLFW